MVTENNPVDYPDYPQMEEQKSFESIVKTSLSSVQLCQQDSFNMTHLVSNPKFDEIEWPFEVDPETMKWFDPNFPISMNPDESPYNVQALFDIDKSHTHLNHGSFGVVFKPVMDLLCEFMKYAETNADYFYIYKFSYYWVQSVKALAKFVNSKPSEIVLTPNSTFGMNSVVKGLMKAAKIGSKHLHSELINAPEYTFVYFSFSYTSTLKVMASEIDFINTVDNTFDGDEETKEKIYPKFKKSSVVTTLPFENFDGMYAGLKSAIKEAHQNGGKVLATIIDVVPSMVSCMLPYDELTSICKEFAPEGYIIMDASHMTGATELDVTKMNADFITFNCHKWMCAPKGTGFLWAPEEHQWLAPPSLTSNGYGSGWMNSYGYQGLQSYLGYLMIKPTLDIMNKTFPKGITEFTCGFLDKAATYLSTEWGTSFPIPLKFFEKSPMRLIYLPPLKMFDNEVDNHTDKDTVAVFDALYHKNKISVIVKQASGKLYVRISAHFYTTMEDIEHLASVVKTL